MVQLSRCASVIVAVSCVALCGSMGAGQIVVPGADGSDGALNATTNRQIDLGLASSGAWDSPSPVAGNGVYDSDKWAVIFKYTSVTIGPNVTLSFVNHRTHAPVVWLVSGDVTINGVLQLSGEAHNGFVRPKEPGPGGFRGAQFCNNGTIPGSAGFGPGGGRIEPGKMCGSDNWGVAGYGTAGVNGAIYSSPTYGFTTIRPLVGGSGGGLWYGAGGGGGGGAILIAATGTITVNGQILANGGYHGGGFSGSGGAIRLVASSVLGPSGQLRALGGDSAAGKGRIRVERVNATTLTNVDPAASEGGLTTGATAVLWPAPSASSVRIVSVGGEPMSADPGAQLDLVSVDRRLPSIGSVEVIMETRNLIPSPGAVWLRVVPSSGYDALVTATLVGGTTAVSTWSALITPAAKASALQALASTTVGQAAAACSREVSIYRRQCAADLDDGSGSGFPDDAVTIDDLVYYLGLYEAGDPAGDLDNGSGTGTGDGAVTIDDLLYFLARYEAGC